jgi:hypothetical protein
MRIVLMPSARQLPEEEKQALHGRIMGRWRKVVMVGILLFLVSGFYNYLAVALPARGGHGPYNALMGIKILLAFGIFLLASALTGRSAAFEGIRRKADLWLGITILLGFLVLVIAGYLKVVQPG